MGGPQAAPSNMQLPGMLASLGRAELLMAAGAALVVVVDIVFQTFGPYGFSDLAWGAAALTLIIIFLNSRMMAFSTSTARALLIMLGVFAAALVAREVLDDLQYLSTPGALPALWPVGALGYYAGSALMVFGAWTLWKSKAA